MNPYLSWEDLLDEVPAEPAPAPPVGAPVALPPVLAGLVAERQDLEAKMAALAGSPPPDARDKRQKLQFPVKVHTVESRLEDRRLLRHDERAHLHTTRMRAATALLRRDAAARATAADERRKRHMLAEREAEERRAARAEAEASLRARVAAQSAEAERARQAVEDVRRAQTAAHQERLHREAIKAELAAREALRETLELRYREAHMTVVVARARARRTDADDHARWDLARDRAIARRRAQRQED